MLVFGEILISLLTLLYFRFISTSCVLNHAGSFNILSSNWLLVSSLSALFILISFYKLDNFHSKRLLLGVIGLGLINFLERIIWGNICDYISYSNIVLGNVVDLFLFLNIVLIIYAEVRDKS